MTQAARRRAKKAVGSVGAAPASASVRTAGPGLPVLAAAPTPEGPAATPRVRPQTLTVVMVLLVLAVTAAVFWQVLNYEFVTWDDDQNILNNAWLRAGAVGRFWTHSFLGMYVPLAYTLWTALAAFGTAPLPMLFHGANLLLHLINAGLVFALAELVTRPGRRSAAGEGPEVAGERRLAACALGTLVFALHPLQVEAVAWVTGLRDLLSAAFALLTVYLYLSRRTPRWRLAAAAAFAAGVLCKPSVVALPIALWFIQAVAWRRPWRVLLRELWPCLALILPVIIVTRVIQDEVMVYAVAPIDLLHRLLTVVDSYGFYLRQLVWPVDLAVDYGRRPEVVAADPEYAKLALVYGLAGVATLGLAWTRPSRWVWAWLGFAGLLLLPTSGIVSFAYQHTSTVADHYAYLALGGVALALAVWLAQLPPRWQSASAAVLVVATSGLVWQSRARLPVWAKDEALYPAMLQSQPNSFAGYVGMSALASRRNDYAGALPYILKAEALEPHNVLTLTDKWLILVRLGRFQQVLDESVGKLPSPADVAASPNSASTMAVMYVVVAYAQIATGQMQASLRSFCAARAADPGNTDVHNFLPFIANALHLANSEEALCGAAPAAP